MKALVAKFSMVCFLFVYLLPLTSYSWNALAHMVIANIAYEKLTPTARSKVDELVTSFNKEYPNINSSMQMAFWLDSVRAQKIDVFSHWHYIDLPFSDDGTALKSITGSDNALWAMQHIIPVVQNDKANPYERARFLAFLLHVVGDLHQPLHTISRLSAKYPDGDKGGNLYYISYKGKRVNLHQFWDSGADTFYQNATIDNATNLTHALTAKYPENYFGNKLEDLNPDNWSKDGYNNAIKYVYTTPENKTPSSAYITNSKDISEQQITLAGYRLAKLLNQVLE